MELGASVCSSSAPTTVPPPTAPENLSSFKTDHSGDEVVTESHKAEPPMIKALTVLVI